VIFYFFNKCLIISLLGSLTIFANLSNGGLPH
jgi:hypothetical protein